MKDGHIRDLIETFMRSFATAVRSLTLYGEEHKLSKESIDKLHLSLTEIFAERSELVIGIIGNELAFEKELFCELSERMSDFLEYLKKRDCNKIRFGRDLSGEELVEFLKMLSEGGSSEENSLQKRLAERGIGNITVGTVGMERHSTGEQVSRELKEAIRQTYAQGEDFFMDAVESMGNGKPIDLDMARQIISGISGNLLRNKSLVLMLASSKDHDESTFVHDINVSIFTILQAQSLGIEERHFNAIGTAALLHDTGKLLVAGEILKKKGSLTFSERARINEHPAAGAKILLKTPGISPLAVITAFEHHIGYDQKGYPSKLFGRDLNLVSMMVTISDNYDAMRSERGYRAGLSSEEVYREMTALSGSAFHPDLLENFFSIIGVYPPGSLVELVSGNIGLVVRENPLHIERPRVELLYDRNGRNLEGTTILDLTEKDPSGVYSDEIVRSVGFSEKYGTSDRYS